MYKYETHMHTAPVSRCGRASVEESLEYYKSLGYDGVFITNHFIGGNINIDNDASYEEKVEFYFSDYEQGVELGKKLGIKVFCGIETCYRGTEFLVYGLDKEWFLSHPEIMEMKKSDELNFLRENGALVIQAHPYREASYINHIRLFPRNIDGVEVINASRPDNDNRMADVYADYYGLVKSAGSDNHSAGRIKILAGICTDTPIDSVDDFINTVKTGELRIFKMPNPLG